MLVLRVWSRAESSVFKAVTKNMGPVLKMLLEEAADEELIDEGCSCRLVLISPPLSSCDISRNPPEGLRSRPATYWILQSGVRLTVAPPKATLFDDMIS